MSRRRLPSSRVAAENFCTHYGHAGKRDEALIFYRSGVLSFSRYTRAYGTGADAARLGLACPCRTCLEGSTDEKQ